MPYLPRHASQKLAALLDAFPAVLVVGPRQCGKTTFVRHELSGWQHFDLEKPSDHGALSADIEGFFARHPRRVVIDEVQRSPALLPVLRAVLDRTSGIPAVPASGV